MCGLSSIRSYEDGGCQITQYHNSGTSQRSAKAAVARRKPRAHFASCINDNQMYDILPYYINCMLHVDEAIFHFLFVDGWVATRSVLGCWCPAHSFAATIVLTTATSLTLPSHRDEGVINLCQDLVEQSMPLVATFTRVPKATSRQETPRTP